MREIVVPTFLSLFQPIGRTLQQIADSGVRLVELHGDAPETHLDLTNEDAVEALVQVVRGLPVQVHSVHCAFSHPSEEAWDISHPEEDKRLAALDRRAQVIRASGRLKAQHVVMHPGGRPRDDGRLARCRDGLLHLTDVAREVRMRIAVENPPPDHLGGTLTEMVWLLDRLDPEVVGFCLDTGHATLGQEPLADYLRALGDRLISLHWHENDAGTDAHLLPEVGDGKWDGFLAALDAVGYDLPITLEAAPPLTSSLEEALRPIRAALLRPCLSPAAPNGATADLGPPASS
jgi:sugar phosphate isomerase/epimerase